MTMTPTAPPQQAGPQQATQVQNPYGITLYTVTSPSGSDLNLQNMEEAVWYEDRRDRYQQDNIFTNVSDVQDLDRLLTLEVMVYRWSLWMAQGFDYQVARIDENQLKNNIKEYSVEIRLLKQSLGIDKSTRDKEKGESLADYTTKLLQRAKQFGIHRNEQQAIVITKFYELRTLVMTYDRCDEEERRLLDLSMDTIFEWIRDEVIAGFDAHSEHFRKNQSTWIRDQ